MSEYKILAINRTYTIPELKKAYRAALLKHHPDKNTTNTEPQYTIDDINRAYQKLLTRDTDLEKISFKDRIEFSEIVDLADLEEKEENNQLIWSRNCRCGSSGYILTETDLENNEESTEIAVQCSICSLWILVQYEVEYDE